MKHLLRWIMKPARPGQFWLPQSGPAGGIIAGLLINLALLIWFVLR